MLPDHLHADLADAWIPRASYDAKVGAAIVPVWIIELRVVEDIEELSSNFQSAVLRNGSRLAQSEVRIQNSGAVEETPIRRAENARLTGGEGIGEKIRIGSVRSGLPRILDLNLANQVRHVGVAAAVERHVAALAEADWEAGGEAANADEIPAVHESLRRGMEGSGEWQSPVVAQHKVVSQIVRRERPAQTVVCEIDPIVKA